MRKLAALAFAALLLAAPSAGCSAEPSAAPGDKTFGDRVRAYLLAHPEVIEEATTKLQARRTAQTEQAARTAITDHRRALERDPRDAVAGNPDGAVTIVEFFDYRCPFCKSSAPAIFSYLRAHKDLRLVLKEFPILSETSEHAARVAVGARSSGKYLAVHQQLLAEKALDDAAIDRVLRANGLDPAAVRKTGAAEATTKQLDDTRALGRTVGVDGTPTFLIGDKTVPGWIEADIDTAVAEARKTTAR